MIAVATGINGLYIFLSAGLGGFIVSGMLSERAMKSSRVQRASAGIVDAGSSFELSFNIENTSSWFTVYAVQTFFFLEKPPLRLISRKLPALGFHTAGKMDPTSTLTCTTRCSELPRGAYARLLAMQQTTFPFGILEKYKFSEVEAGLLVAPAVDSAFLADLRALLRRRLAASDADKEFFSHRRYSHKDSLKHLDWKKSAGRKPEDWVVKVFRTKSLNAPVLIEVAWDLALACRTEAEYEALLGRVRTACLAVAETAREVCLELGRGMTVLGYESALAMLAAAPRFADRHQGPGISGVQPKASAHAMRLIVEAQGARWAA
jgi:uncharacterized protein (DUF58 family)